MSEGNTLVQNRREYVLANWPAKSMRQIADELGVDRRRVGQIVAKERAKALDAMVRQRPAPKRRPSPYASDFIAPPPLSRLMAAR